MFPFYSFGYFYYIVPIIQIICILHALKTNRRDWIYILIFLPGVGGIIYFFREILPGLRHSGVNGATVKAFFPSNRIKELERNLKIADTDANRIALAKEYARQQNYTKAIELTSSCLKGIYANNVDMMLDMGRYTFGAERFEESLSWLNKVLQIKHNKFDRPEDELLYARALHQVGDEARAEVAYRQMIRVHHSIEGRYHYGLLLKATGRSEEAKKEFSTILEERTLHPKHVRRNNAPSINGAKRELAKLKSA